MDKKIYEAFVNILKEELKPAMGCTEPISVAYAGALARQTLGQIPEKIKMTISGNIIKNVKSVIVPHTGGRKGLKTAIAAGICYGNAEDELEVLSKAQPEQIKMLEDYLKKAEIDIRESDTNCPFDIEVMVYTGKENAYVHLFGNHTNLVALKKNGSTLLDKPVCDTVIQSKKDREMMTVKDIVEFAEQVDIQEIKEVIGRQIECNMAIAKAGMEQGYGARIGRILLDSYGDSVQNMAKAYAAAGSDARMNGCELPVVINSGSGNQGITASVPVIIYAKQRNVTEEKLYRALVISNLVTIHLKTGIGSLSAYCGATSAGCGAGAGISYLYGGGYDEIAHTIVNALAINSGMLCDGAKSSCAAKIASAVEAGLLGMQMNIHDSQFYDGDGIIVKGVENNIKTVSMIAREGMRQTDEKIIHHMIDKDVVSE